MFKEIEDKDFEKLVAEKQHEQFMLAIKKLMVLIDSFDNKQLQFTLTKIDNNLDKINKIDNNTIDVLKKLSESLEKLQKSVKFENLEKQKEENIDSWTFTVNRDSQGLITSVNALKF